MWDVEEIKIKKRNVIRELKKCSNEDMRDKLSITLVSYISMLENSGTIRYTKFYNLMDKVTKGQFTLMRPGTKMIVKAESILDERKNYMDIDYLSFLLELCKNVASTEKVIKDYSGVVLEKVNLDNNTLIKFSKLFYSSLGDK